MTNTGAHKNDTEPITEEIYMLKSQELSIKLSEKRQKINDLLSLEKRTEEQTNELDALTKEVQAHETEFRAALVSEDAAVDAVKDDFDDVDGETLELRSIRSKAKLGEYVKAAVEKRSIQSGAENELNQALQIPANQFPLILLAGEPEKRVATDADTAVRPRPWLTRLFADSLASYLGINFSSVPAGVATYPILGANAFGGAQRAKGEAAAESAWTVSTSELKPTGNAIHIRYNREDILRLPGLEQELISTMRMALRESLDRAVFYGDDDATGTDADITGLDAATGVVEKTLTQANKVKADKTLEAFTTLVDGIYAGGLDDLRIVISEGTFQLWNGTVLSVASETASVFKTLAEFLTDNKVMGRVRQLEAATTDGKLGAFISRRRGLTGASAAPVWAGAELITDKYTAAKTRETLLTLTTFWNFSLPRPANFARLKYVA